MNSDETTERYLETIYFLGEKHDGVHAVDVSKEMRFSKPTVSVKLKQLAAEGYVNVDENEHIILTEKGEAIARKIGERHILLTKMLVNLGVDAETAESDACKIEHDLSDESFEKLKAHINNHR